MGLFLELSQFLQVAEPWPECRVAFKIGQEAILVVLTTIINDI